jgi:AcrR family transcriptional regulator
MSSELPPSTREPGRRGKQGETRARLIQVAIELVRLEGLSALTTSRITRAAGIAQPGFYAHFKNVDDIVRSTVVQVIEEMRAKIATVRKRSFERLREATDFADPEAIRGSFVDSLEVFLSDPSFAEIFLRYRRDPSLLGGFMRQAAQRVREDLTADIWRNARAVGFRAEHYPLVSFYAEQVLALYFAAAEAMLDGRYQDKQMVIDSLVSSSFAIMRATLRSAGLGDLLRGGSVSEVVPRRGVS